MNKHVFLSAILSAAALCTSIDARAQICNSSSVCATISQSGSGEGLEVIANGSGTAIQVIGPEGSSAAITVDTTADGIDVGVNTGIAFRGTSNSNYGVQGISGLTGVEGQSGSGQGVAGFSSSNYGVEGTSTSSYGVFGTSTSGDGVHGTIASAGSAVGGVNTGSGNAIYGRAEASGAWAGNFEGNVQVQNGYSYFYNGSTCIGGHCTSDQRLKKNIEPLTGAISQLLQLRGATYEWKNPEEHGNQTGVQTGFIAQEVEKSFPAWVDEDKKGMKGIVLPPMQIAALEVESFRELKAEVDDLKAEVKELKENRRPAISGLGAEGMGMGFGLVVVGGAFIASRRKRAESGQ